MADKYFSAMYRVRDALSDGDTGLAASPLDALLRRNASVLQNMFQRSALSQGGGMHMGSARGKAMDSQQLARVFARLGLQGRWLSSHALANIRRAVKAWSSELG